jgi:flagellin-specific chaperone FliS
MNQKTSIKNIMDFCIARLLNANLQDNYSDVISVMDQLHLSKQLSNQYIRLYDLVCLPNHIGIIPCLF